ncbi:hypothetical protein [Lyngbya sp. CCY1209]|uniref:hypothetical protein n=1 Tax=Lyngbya sp. CCY1209 TaxID=2886103 RepID=UPI002D217A31|nr:hypothetical protein [Lyngbya sp. CCY1209]MEB3883171.1 hypothetical protein [Lyngbya sp. CCY1209]
MTRKNLSIFTDLDDILKNQNYVKILIVFSESRLTIINRKFTLSPLKIMLHFTRKRKAIEALQEAVKEHEVIREQVKQASIDLFKKRQRVASEVIESVELYVNTLSNSPKEFDKAVSEFRYQVNCFLKTVQEVKQKSSASTQVATGSGAAGVAAGVGVAAFGPTAAMAVATTFGTASTGTAIASLSGAAATNAALAWLGGGALAAGGGGMAAGNALLAMAGPVGWTIGGVALVGSGIFVNQSNAKVAEEATEKRLEVNKDIIYLKKVDLEVKKIAEEIKNLADKCLKQLLYFLKEAPRDYRQFSQEKKEAFGSLINCIRSLGKLLNHKI